jgi:hypothetical protein
MRTIRALLPAAICVFCTGCVTAGNETVQFQAQKTQQVMMRDGESTITSRALRSIVTMRSADRKVGSRPVFIVGMQNISRQPLEFRVGEIAATQIVGGQPVAQLKVFTYDELVQEEQNAQVGRAVLVGVLGGVSAGLAGRNEGLQNQVAYQNAVLASQVGAAGAQNLAALEQLALKDQTVLPGETYAGKLYVQGPDTQNGGAKMYSLIVQIGPDRHEIVITQGS